MAQIALFLLTEIVMFNPISLYGSYFLQTDLLLKLTLEHFSYQSFLDFNSSTTYSKGKQLTV